MKHYELFKLTPGADTVAVQLRVAKTFDKLDAELDWLNHPVVYRNCGNNADADIMAVVEIDSEEQLPLCLENKHYVKLAEHLRDVLVSRMTFDHY